MGHILEVYDNGNCNGSPFASMEIVGDMCKFYPNGNANGIHIWSMRKTDNDTEVYSQPGLNGTPYNYFKYVPPGRWGGAYGAVEFYPNGNANGIPEYFFSFRSEDEVVFYPTGNANGIPDIAYFELCGRTVYYYPNGNGNGSPTATIAGVYDIREVIELVFYLFIPHGRGYRPSDEIRTDTGSTDYGPGSGIDSDSYSDSGGSSGPDESRDSDDRGWEDSDDGDSLGGDSREGDTRFSSPNSGGGSRFRELFDRYCSMDSNGRIRVYDPDDDDDDDVDEWDSPSNLDDRPLLRNRRSRSVVPDRVNRLGRRSLHDDDDDDDGDARDFTPRRVPRRNDIERSLGERIFITLLICLFLGIIIWLLTSQ